MDIDIINLCVNIDEKKVLDNLNLNIKKSEIHVIMGPNGVGKSTLSKVLMGHSAYKVISGDILVDEKSILNLDTFKRSEMGMFLSFQNPLEIEGVINSDFLRTIVNNKNKEIVPFYDFIKELDSLCVDLDINKEMLHRSINQNFSGGEKKKNEILQMNLLKPKFIILDELDSGLDIDALKKVCININNYIKEYPDTSVLIITHYPRILDFLHPSYVHILTEGKIIKSGDMTLAQNIDNFGYKFAEIGTSAMGKN